MTKSISLETLKERLSNGKAPVLLEALPARHFLDGHLPGALHMPHERVAELAPVVVPDKQADVVVYCASATCRNSHQAADSLARLGMFEQITHATDPPLPLPPMSRPDMNWFIISRFMASRSSLYCSRSFMTMGCTFCIPFMDL